MAGNPGCGKTLLARILLHAAGGQYRAIDYTDEGIVSVWNAVFKAEPELLDEIRETYGYEGGTRQLINKCANARLLIIDDLGAGYVKDGSQEWYTALMWRFLDNRKDKRTIVTTNLSPQEFSKHIGPRAWSRLKEVLGLTASGSSNVIDLFNVPEYRAINWEGIEK